eukprot:TRINITY_DN27782_c0_g2_i2.p1 TRINITY_DN27782_c0_g2~~TRINITY_DN27782_c0_g2_i2.p1  ORF type:complete len:426 (+),score=103.04 TRINITY_DN27782_c0_g2_i2:108-1385(+)
MGCQTSSAHEPQSTTTGDLVCILPSAKVDPTEVVGETWATKTDFPGRGNGQPIVGGKLNRPQSKSSNPQWPHVADAQDGSCVLQDTEDDEIEIIQEANVGSGKGASGPTSLPCSGKIQEGPEFTATTTSLVSAGDSSSTSSCLAPPETAQAALPSISKRQKEEASRLAEQRKRFDNQRYQQREQQQREQQQRQQQQQPQQKQKQQQQVSWFAPVLWNGVGEVANDASNWQVPESAEHSRWEQTGNAANPAPYGDFAAQSTTNAVDMVGSLPRDLENTATVAAAAAAAAAAALASGQASWGVPPHAQPQDAAVTEAVRAAVRVQTTALMPPPPVPKKATPPPSDPSPSRSRIGTEDSRRLAEYEALLLGSAETQSPDPVHDEANADPSAPWRVKRRRFRTTGPLSGPPSETAGVNPGTGAPNVLSN